MFLPWARLPRILRLTVLLNEEVSVLLSSDSSLALAPIWSCAPISKKSKNVGIRYSSFLASCSQKSLMLANWSSRVRLSALSSSLSKINNFFSDWWNEFGRALEGLLEHLVACRQSADHHEGPLTKSRRLQVLVPEVVVHRVLEGSKVLISLLKA